jgi:hypothetical protein
MESKLQITRPKKTPLSTSTRAVVSFDNDDQKIAPPDKARIHSSPSFNRGGLGVVVPSTLKGASAKFGQSSITDANISSPHMVTNSYVLTPSDDETDQVDGGEISGGYFSRKPTSKKSDIERRGTLNTINTLLEDEDDEEPDFRILKNLTDDAFDKYESVFLLSLKYSLFANK